MSTLVLVEHNNKVMHHATRNTLAAALELGKQPTFLVIGHQCKGVAEQVATLAGVHAVWCVDKPCYEHQLPEQISELVASFVSSFNAILASSSTYGKNIVPRIAALLDVAQISDVSKIIDSNTFEHPIYAGKRIDVYACNVDHNAVIQQGKLVETAHMHRFHMTQLMTGDPGQPGWDDASKHVKNKFVQ